MTKNYTIIKQLDRDSFIVEIKTKDFEGRRLATQEDISSGKNLNLFYEENYAELKGK
jgi:hypothetical protein